MPADTDPVVIPAGLNDPVVIPAPTPGGTPEGGGDGFLEKVNAALSKPSPEVLQAPEAAVRELVGGMMPHDLPSYLESLFPPAAMAHQAVNMGEGLAQGDVSGVPLIGRIPEIMQADETPAGSKERYLTAMKTLMDLGMLVGGGEGANDPVVTEAPPPVQPPPVPEQYQGRFTMVPPAPEQAPQMAPSPPIEQTLQNMPQQMPFNPELGPQPQMQPDFQMPLQTESGPLMPGAQPQNIVPPPPIGTPLKPIPLVGPNGSTPAFDAATAQAPSGPPAQAPQVTIPPEDAPYAGQQPQAGEGVPVAPATGGNPPGIANRYVEEQIYRGELPPEAMATGTGTTARAAADEARARLAQDPNLAFQAARRIRNGSVQGGDTAILHAYNDQLAEGAAQARQVAFANPGDAELRAAADNAEKAHVQFLQDVKPLAGGLAQRIMVGFQGAYPPDLSTYAGMYKEMTQLNEGRPVPPEIRSNLYRRAAKAQKAAQAEKAAGDRLQQAIDKNLPKRPVPTKEQMSARMEEFKRRVAPCP